jgi:hypothetical protein
MPRNHIGLIITLSFIVICSGCDAIRVLTAIDHKPEMETPESIRHFAKKHNIDGQPILRFDTSIFSSESDLYLTFQMFNHKGQYLSLRDTAQGCPDKKQNFTAMHYILEHGDTHFIKDSMMIWSATLKDPSIQFSMKDLKRMDGIPEDTSVWQIQKETFGTHLDNYVPFFNTLEGEFVDIYSLYPEYLVLFGYQMSGKSKLDCILIREKMKELEKLNEEFGPRIQLVLVNRDEMASPALSNATN